MRGPKESGFKDFRSHPTGQVKQGILIFWRSGLWWLKRCFSLQIDPEGPSYDEWVIRRNQSQKNNHLRWEHVYLPFVWRCINSKRDNLILGTEINISGILPLALAFMSPSSRSCGSGNAIRSFSTGSLSPPASWSSSGDWPVDDLVQSCCFSKPIYDIFLGPPPTPQALERAEFLKKQMQKNGWWDGPPMPWSKKKAASED